MNLTTYAIENGGTGTIKCPVLASTAQAAGCSAGTLYMISKGHKKPSAVMAKAISLATGGKVEKHELLPEVFDPPADSSAAA